MKKIFIVSISVLIVCVSSIYATTKPLNKVNLNTATAAQLITLKGIGEKKAKAIIVYRKQHGALHSVQDLKNIRGIGVQFIQRLLHKNPNRIVA